MFIALLISAAVMTPDAHDASREEPAARGSATPENSRGAYVSQRVVAEDASDVETMLLFALAISAHSVHDDMRSIIDRLKRLIREKQEARELLSAMRQEQRRLHHNPELKQQQQAWAYSLKGLCPPGADQDDCLLRQLRSRIAALDEQQTPTRR